MRLAKLVLCVLVLTIVNLAEAAVSSQRVVMTWIPPYGVEKSVQNLKDYPDILKGLTRVGLQFWNPSVDGKSVVLAPADRNGSMLNQVEVKRVIQLLKAHHIQVLLTVYNNSQVSNHWDWELAKRAFKEHRQEFTDSLIATMLDYGLDGIDLDLEGEGDFDIDREAYAVFVKGLAGKLKKLNKRLTIDSFHSPCTNAPNMRWWSDWRGYVDAIHSMGYQDLYEGSTQTFTPSGSSVCENGAYIFKYSWQLAYGQRAGYRAHQIVLGMPTWLASWGEGGLGSGISSHLLELQNVGAGVALWDLQLAEPQWRSSLLWIEIQRFRHAIGRSQ